ncbi:coagulation factor IX isoform X2 [Esox lucius]|nr:coagulation factor IX isoform X2 [Esox lucius]XP_010901665.1 coagulation factor IX isoform X2 [Esox lucius]XP_019902559.1 coagulation factor IX isoform X2 [Esox lucius]
MLQSKTWLITLLLISVYSLLESKVFLEPRDAVQLLRGVRRPRANSFLEEIMPGNLERECYEETCSQEEAAEIFQTKEKTMEFWYRYKNLNPCHYNPCKNGGICTTNRDEYLCLCPPRYEGKTCAIEVFECQFKNGGCLHYCTDQERTKGVQCSCAEGYKLDEDGKTCSEAASFPCGLKLKEASLRRSLPEEYENITLASDVPSSDWNTTTPMEGEGNSTQPGVNSTEDLTDVNEDSRIVGGQLEKQGGSPWQVLIHRKDGYGFCGGTLISQRWVISAAHCMEQTPDHITIGDYDKERPDPGEQKIHVERVVVHPHFHEYTFDSDIALMYLSSSVVLSPAAIPICLPNDHLAQHLQRDDVRGLVTGWGATQYFGRSSRFLRKVYLPMVDQQECIRSTEQVITDNMFCAGYTEASMDACSGDSGGPFVVNYRGTWFLTGVVSWGEQCAARGKYGVFTRLGNYLHWIKDTVENQDHNSTHT